MNKKIVGITDNDYQLVSIGIDLVHKVFSVVDCDPVLEKNPHFAKVVECANQWSKLFYKAYITKEGA